MAPATGVDGGGGGARRAVQRDDGASRALEPRRGGVGAARLDGRAPLLRAQEQLMRTWLSERDGAVAPFDIRFYPARFDVMRGSILPIGDTTRWVGDVVR